MNHGQFTVGDEAICTMVRNHFGNLRQRQRQGMDLSTTTEDIRFILKFIGSSVPHPVAVLQTMGIIHFRRFLAFNFAALQANLVLSRTRIMSALYREGWKEADASAQLAIAPIVGEADVKEWACLVVPGDTDLARELIENAPLTAADAGGADAPRCEARPARAPRFPLVRVEYERDLVTEGFTIAPAPRRALALVHFEPMAFRVGAPGGSD
jgi:hypothetical protein